MSIGNAVEKGGFVYVYDEKGRRIATLPSGNRPADGLKGYTSTTVNVKRGGFIYTYNEKGQQIGTTSG
jgi:hypothetical protein